MYLKENVEGPFVTLVSFFRVVVSAYGRGHALVLLEAPSVPRGRPEALNVCVTDNDALARWLVTEFVAYFRAFRGVAALASLRYIPLTTVTPSGDHRGGYVEWIKGDGVDAILSWEDLGDPFMVALPVDKSPTGRHEMLSVFVEATRATVTVNGRRLKGRPVARDFAGRPSTTAFLAYSETWLRP